MIIFQKDRTVDARSNSLLVLEVSDSRFLKSELVNITESFAEKFELQYKTMDRFFQFYREKVVKSAFVRQETLDFYRRIA